MLASPCQAVILGITSHPIGQVRTGRVLVALAFVPCIRLFIIYKTYCWKVLILWVSFSQILELQSKQWPYDLTALLQYRWAVRQKSQFLSLKLFWFIDRTAESLQISFEIYWQYFFEDGAIALINICSSPLWSIKFPFKRF